jgi:hypothetical protein
MPPATEPFDAPQKDGEFVLLPLAADTRIFAGTLVAINGDGNALPAADTAGLKVMGRAEQTIDNRDGLAGDLTVLVRRGVFAYANSAGDPVDANDIGKPAYVEDDITVCEAGADNMVPAGLVVDLDDAGVWIDTRLAPALGQAPKTKTVATLAGGAASEAVALPGVADGDLVQAAIVDNLANDNVYLLEAKPSADTVTLLFNEDPTAGVKVAIVVYRP